MKKFLLSICLAIFFGVTASAQTDQDAFDKKHRFGIRVTPQPTWFKSDNSSSKGNGAYFGFGFGLVWEIKLSNIIHFSTGIGGDFEGGSISYRYEPNVFEVQEVIDSEGILVEAKDGATPDQYYFKNGNSSYILKNRKYKTTMITIPLLLKMMTNEYSGFRYFANFGGELGIRAAAKANDTFYAGFKAASTATGVEVMQIAEGDLKRDDINLGKDATILPFRVGMNLGLGTEYRIAGSTSLVFSVNYFQSFTSLMRKESKFLTKERTIDPATGKFNFEPLNQSYLMRAVRINIAIMF
ncbi:MAG: outer membrane beta-barrel protein [Bacteroidota bacterium]